MSAPTELDDETRARLRWEAERLAAEQDMSLADARKIVWQDYQDELAQRQIAAKPVDAPPIEEVAEPTAPEPQKPTGTGKRFWNAKEEPAFTPEWLKRNRQQLAKVKRLVGAKQ